MATARAVASTASWRMTGDFEKEPVMGDKGGKKDKEKNKQQQVKKHQQQAQRKEQKAGPAKP